MADGRWRGDDTSSVTALLGSVMPADIEERRDGLYVRGYIDQSHDAGRYVFKMLRSGALKWSIGFRVARSHREGNARVIDEVDELLELSAVPIPSNSRTATLDAKADEEVPSHAEVERRLIEAGLITRPASASAYSGLDASLIGGAANGDRRHDGEKSDLRRRSRDLVLALFGVERDETELAAETGFTAKRLGDSSDDVSIVTFEA